MTEMNNEVDAANLVDEMPVSRVHMRIFGLCGLVGLLDGMDSQTIGIVARPMAAELAIPTSSLGPVFSAMTLGAALGAMCLGSVADRFGRKRLMVVSTLVFALFTFLTARVSNLPALILCRFAVGIGLGGAVPCFLSLGSEYAPRRWRGVVTSALWVGFPLGGIVGAFVVRYLLSVHTWRSVFYVGGIAPIFLVAGILLYVPESLQFLMANRASSTRLRHILQSLQPDLMLPDGSRFRLPSTSHNTSSLAALFTQGRWRATVLLWIGFAFLFGTLSMLNLWSPTLLGQRGMSITDAAWAIAFWNVGGVVGTACSGLLVKKWGGRVLPVALVLGSVSTGLLGQVTGFALPALLLMLVCLFLGASAGAAISLAGSSYDDAARATGIGWAMGLGRVGQVAGPLAVGGLVVLQWPLAQVFLLIAAAPLLSAAAIIGSRRISAV